MPRIRPEGGLSGTYQTPNTTIASGMWTMRDLDRNLRAGSWPIDSNQSDPYFKYNVLLTHFNGSDNTNNNLIKDSVSTNEVSRLPFENTFGAYFPGTLGYKTPANGNFTLTGDFTMEMYVYFSGSPTDVSLFNNYTSANGSTEFTIEVSAANKFAVFLNGLSSVRITGTTTVTTGVWYHVALVRSAGVNKLYVNGVQEGSSYSFAGTIGTGNAYYIAQYNNAARLTGNLSNLRVTNTAVYTSNFTPPTTTLTAISGTQLLVATTTTFIDSSPNALTLTLSGTGSLTINPAFLTLTGAPGQGTFSPYSTPNGYWSSFFDGAGFLNIPANANYLIGTQDFTLECWIYAKAGAATQGIITSHQTGGMLQFYLNTNGTLYVAVNNNGGTTTTYTTMSTTSTINQTDWNHIALVRSGTEVAVYINGVKDATTITLSAGTNIGSYGGNKPIYIAAGADQAGKFTGIISNVRYVVGNAVYTANFTPSTTPLTAITNTKLLTCQSNRFVDNSSYASNITVTASSLLSPFSPFAYTTAYSANTHGGSISFNGTNEYGRITSAINELGFGTADFTVEYWVYLYNVGAGFMFDTRTSGGGAAQTKVLMSANNTNIVAYVGSTQIIASTTPTSVVTGQWLHIALVRSSAVTRMYVNGVQQSTTYSDTNNYGANSQLSLGTVGDSPGYAATFLRGYISDFRVTKRAVYTSAFTPPSEPLSAVANTTLLITGRGGNVIDNSRHHTLSTVNNAVISTTQSKFGNSSIYLNGTTSTYLKSPTINSSSWFRTGDFTVEAWVYFSSIGAASQQILSIVGTSTFSLLANSTNIQVASGNFATTFNSGQWYHIAVSRQGSICRVFKDGAYLGANSTHSFDYYGFGTLAIGATTSGTNLLNGYIDEMRISKYARYTSNSGFTVPNSEFKDL